MSSFSSFSSYDNFLSGLAESLNTEFYGETFPDYEHECNEFGSYHVNEIYINNFLGGGLDPQEGLSKMIDCLCENSRYAREAGVIEHHIRLFLNAGAKLFPLTPKILYIPHIKSMYEFEDAIFCNGIEVRAAIIDSYWNHLDQNYIASVTEWSAVKPKYWEFISLNETPAIAFYRYYKCLSDYLRGEHTRFTGNRYEEGERMLAKQEFMDRMCSAAEDSDGEF
jgi:hypothetical protein